MGREEKGHGDATDGPVGLAARICRVYRMCVPESRERKQMTGE